MDEKMRAPLERWLGEQRREDVSIVALRRIATGNSRANWYVETSDGARYVVRVEQGGVFGSTSSDEFGVMQAAHALGCRVAPVRWLEPTGAVLGQPFFAMDYVDGVATGRNDRSMSDELAVDFVVQLAQLHRADWSSEIATEGLDIDATHAAIDLWRGVYRGETEVAIPLLEEAAAWLHHHAPAPSLIGIVHGDPGPGNFVHDGSRVIAFTDWEFAHIGDPMEDWAYLITMRGASTMSRAEWLALFERAAGVRVTDGELHYWSVFNFFKGACANLTCRRVFRTLNPAPNMALIGTALHQTYVRQVATLIGEADRRC
jgi:aminoglycoside phosphotransferase (APT) family kinase protein